MINQPRMDPRIKQTMIDALIKVVESAPTRAIGSPFGYSPYNTPYSSPYNPQPIPPNPYEITQSRFDIWLNYVNSTLQITSQYVDPNLCFTVKNNIQMVALQPGLNLATKTNSICQILLDFARSLINL